MLMLPLNEVVLGDCLEVLRTIPDNSIDSVCTDPPYGLGKREPTPQEVIAYLMGEALKTGDFMDKPWDIPPVAVWKECFRVLKPGGHLLAFAGTRTFDLMSMGIRMAGFENRDTIAAEFGPSVLQWMHGQGFPKSHDVSKNIDKRKGVTRKVIGTKKGVGGENLNDIVKGRDVRQTTDEGGKGVGAYGVGAKQVAVDIPVTAPESDEAKQWEGWGTALKPAWEPIVVFRKPVEEGSVVGQVLVTGTGALNIDGCRVRHGEGTLTGGGGKLWSHYRDETQERAAPKTNDTGGRWPANVILVHGDGCRIVGSTKVKAPVINRFGDGMKPFGDGAGHEYTSTQMGDENGEEEVVTYECVEGCPVKCVDTQNGGASRFFAQFEPEAPFLYCGKAGPSEKTIQSEVELEEHPTVKPIKLMRYLVRLVTPPGGVVLDPYSGSGTTACAAVLEGVNFVVIDKHAPYVERAKIRIKMAREGAFDAVVGKPKPEKVRKPKISEPQVEIDSVNVLDLALGGE